MGIQEYALNPQAVVAQVLCFLLAVVLWRRYLSPISDIPGPALASVTRFWHVYYIWNGSQADKLVSLHEELGPFVRISPDEVSVTHPDGIKQLLITPQRKSYFYEVLRFPDWRFSTPMSTVDPKEKIERSKVVAPAYKMTSILQSEDAISRTVEMLLDWMEKYAENNEPMDLAEFITFTTFDVVGEVVFSKPFGYIKKGDDIQGSLHQTIALSLYVSIASYFQWIHYSIMGNPLITWLNILPTNHLVNTAVKALNERKANPDARFDYVAHWLRIHENNPNRLTARDIQSVVQSNVGAGGDTVSCAIQSFVYHMIRHPNAWGRARTEIDEASRSQGLCQDRVISYADAQKLPYLQACIKESLRIFCPVPMGLPRVAPKGGITIGDRTFPAGTVLSVFPPGIHLSKDIWGPDAKEFKPERWLGDDATTLDKYFMPWGQGYNACVGQNVARVELSKITSSIVRDFDIQQVDPNKNWRFNAYFTVVPRDWPVYIKKRNAL